MDAEPLTVISEKGRPVTGYRIHKCGESNASESEADGEKEKTGG
ncbi:hypothetical protein [Treponema sp. R6D11]